MARDRRGKTALECWMVGKPGLKGASISQHVPYDLQEQILSLNDAGTSFRAISKMLGVKEAAVIGVIDHGTVFARPTSPIRCNGCGAKITQIPCLTCVTRRRLAR